MAQWHRFKTLAKNLKQRQHNILLQVLERKMQSKLTVPVSNSKDKRQPYMVA